MGEIQKEDNFFPAFLKKKYIYTSRYILYNMSAPKYSATIFCDTQYK